MQAKPTILTLVVSSLLAILLFPGTALADNDLVAGGTNMTTQAASDHTADDAINWAKSKVGTPVGYDDGSGYYQCVEFIQAYYQYLGVSAVSGNGCDYAWNALPAGWTRTAGGQPQKGDILVYGAYGSQAYGHVAIYESDNSLYDQDGSVWGATVKHEAANYRSYTWAYWGCIHPNFANPVDHNPKIAFDGAAAGDGRVRVTGWTYDPDVVWQSNDVHVYLFQDGNPTCIGGTTANVSRKDVDNALHVGEFHGFDVTFGTSLRGTVDVQVAALNLGEGVTTWSEKKTVTVLEPKGDAVSVDEGRYTIRSKLDTSMCLDVVGHSLENTANVQLWKWNSEQESGGTCEKFDIKAAGNGLYYVIATHSDKAVEVYGAYTNSGANVSQYTQNQTPAQGWYFDKNSDGTYTMRNLASGLAMDVTDAKTANGTNIQQCTRNGSDAQKFYLVPTDVSKWSVALPLVVRTYTGKAWEPAPTVTAGGVTMKEGVDYTVSYKNNVNAGTATVTVTGRGGFTGSKSTTFAISPASLSGSTIKLSSAEFVYDGSAKMPTAWLYSGQPFEPFGSTWIPWEGYDVHYSDNVNVGTATVTVTGKGNYTGTAKATFEIKADSQSSGGAQGSADNGGAGDAGSPGDQPSGSSAGYAPARFSDVPANHWVSTEGWLSYVLGKRLMSGYAGIDCFGPDDPITRGQVATILFRYANPGSKATTDASSYASNTTKFRDNASGQYYTAAMNWALEQGVFTGDSATGYTTVRPGDGITRQELATVLYRFATGRGASAAGASAATYAAAPDARSVQGWASEGMGWCYKNSVMTGDSSTGRLNPAGGATRAHMAKMITVVTRDVLGA